MNQAVITFLIEEIKITKGFLEYIRVLLSSWSEQKTIFSSEDVLQ